MCRCAAGAICAPAVAAVIRANITTAQQRQFIDFDFPRAMLGQVSQAITCGAVMVVTFTCITLQA
jgi:hypothetical protein